MQGGREEKADRDPSHMTIEVRGAGGLGNPKANTQKHVESDVGLNLQCV